MINKIQLSLLDKWFKLIVWHHNIFSYHKKKAKFKDWLNHIKPSKDWRILNSTVERTVEIHDWERAKSALIFTCYFTKKEDPQNGMLRLNPDINYISPWYSSMVKLELDGIILHDGLDPLFIEEYETKNIKFRKVSYGNYSIFEERWFLYYQCLVQLNLSSAFFTDANDVYITKDPFPYCNKSKTLYVGRDNANKIRHSDWLKEEQTNFENESNYHIPKAYLFQDVYNAGVVGGDSSILKAVASSIINLTLMTNSKVHKDMTLINLTIFNNFPIKLYYSASEKPIVNSKLDISTQCEFLFSGFPLNSAFKKYEFDSTAYFIHK